MTPEDLDRLKEIIDNVENKQWLINKNIGSTRKGDYYVLNYNQGGDRNQYNRLARGLVIDARTYLACFDRVVSLPFTRFFNYGEKDAAQINLDNSDMIEKLDGCMVAVTLVNGEPFWQTRRLISAHQPDLDMTVTSFNGKDHKLLTLIGEYVKKLRLQEGITYTFEFIHEATFVWTKYKPEEWGLYLIGVRNLNQENLLSESIFWERTMPYFEYDEYELGFIAGDIGAKRPKLWDGTADFTKIRELMERAKQERADFEGFVFRDRNTGARLKLKDSEYVDHHKMLGKYSVADLVKTVLEDEIEEVAAYYPHLRDPMLKIQFAVAKYAMKISSACCFYSNVDWSRAEVYEDSVYNYDPFVTKQVMTNLQTKPEDLYEKAASAIKNLGLGFGKTVGQPKKLIELLKHNGLLENCETEASFE